MNFDKESKFKSDLFYFLFIFFLKGGGGEGMMGDEEGVSGKSKYVITIFNHI